MTEWILRDRRERGMVQHPSTEGMLLAMKTLAANHGFNTILDLGCGSGLLTLAATEYWPQARVTAADINPRAVEDCLANIRQYGLEQQVRVLRSDGFSSAPLRAGGPYGLMLCNLLAEHHLFLAADIKRHLQPGGYAVLSGVLAWMAPQLTQVFITLGFEIAGEISVQGWQTLLLRQR